MLPLIEEDLPEFLLQRSNLAYCNNLHLQVGGKRLKSTLVLSRHFKFYEFRKKELLHHIDLRQTGLKQLGHKLQSYNGPLSSFLLSKEVSQPHSVDYSMLQAVEDLPVSLGKFVWLGEHVYVLLRCWDMLAVLRRPPEHGSSFELQALHESVEDYKLVHGPLRYQAYVELHFTQGKRLLTNFQSSQNQQTSCRTPITNGCQQFKGLLQQIHQTRSELSVQRAQTQLDFVRARDLLAFGSPSQRSPLLEEKQPLRRYGDVWTRICGDYLVIGCLLSNIAGGNRLTIVQSPRPLINLDKEDASLSLEHRLYELPLLPDGQPPDDYDNLAQFWSCQEQHSQRLDWRLLSSSPSQLLPERTAVLLVRLQLAELLQVGKLQLMVLYELGSSLTRQLHLASLDVASLLEQPESHLPSFAPATLHQDFLAVIITQPAHCVLRLEFLEHQVDKFEELLVSCLGFEMTETQGRQIGSNAYMLDASCPATAFESISRSSSEKQRIFYQRQSFSQWHGLLLLHNADGHVWHMYAQSSSKLSLFLNRLLRDLLQLHCNVSVMELDELSGLSCRGAVVHLEAALREELKAWRDILEQQSKPKDQEVMKLYQLQMASDVLATVIKSKHPQEPH